MVEPSHEEVVEPLHEEVLVHAHEEVVTESHHVEEKETVPEVVKPVIEEIKHEESQIEEQPESIT